MEVESIVNSRPLTYVAASDWEEPITPSHLLIGRRVLNLPDALSHSSLDPGDEEFTLNASQLEKRRKLLNDSVNLFWKRWRTEYLTELRDSHRKLYHGRAGSPSIAIGDVVIVHDESLPRGFWKLGVIEEVISGKDGQVRGATVRSHSSDKKLIRLNRPIQLLYPLEVRCDQEVVESVPVAGSEEQVRLIHSQHHIDVILDSIPESNIAYLDGDTVVSPNSGKAALYAIGSICDAIDQVLSKTCHNAFCAVRPPGHHAETDRAMGFCLFNNIAVATQYARSRYAIGPVAIVDFDVHHGNGTQQAFYSNRDVLYGSTHQSPLFPGTGAVNETGVGNIINAPLSAGSGTAEFQNAMKQRIFPAIHKMKPELLLISAGFDAHKADPLASLQLVESDFAWVTRQLMDIADRYCDGRLVSSLEGGYNLDALGRSTAAHVRELMRV